MIFSDFPQVEISRAVDGDTVEALMPEMPLIFQKLKIRVKGIDSAEMKGERKCEREDADRAKQKMANLVTGKTVDLYFCTPDKYGSRIDCTVFVDGIDVGAFMIDQQLAVPYSGGTRQPWRCSVR